VEVWAQEARWRWAQVVVCLAVHSWDLPWRMQAMAAGTVVMGVTMGAMEEGTLAEMAVVTLVAETLGAEIWVVVISLLHRVHPPWAASCFSRFPIVIVVLVVGRCSLIN